jgi:fimbrial isopeptide formation D2 family protein/LPXTG-motif cell wall-anchored protein
MIPCLLFSGVLGITTLASGNTEPIPGHNNSIQEMNSLMEQDDAGAIFIHTTSLEEVDFTVTKMNKVTWVTDYQDLEGNYYEKSSTSFTISADETGLATFTDLPMGDYYVEEISHNSLSLYGEPFFVHLPAPHPKRSDEMLTSVNIYLKETKLGIDKYARNDSSMGGRLAHWQITTNISRGLLGRADIFAVSDELDRRLEYVEGSGVIKADDGTGNFTDVTNWFDIHLEGQTLTFTLKQEYDVDFLEYTQVDFDFTTVINIQNESDLTDIFNVANVQYQGASQMVPDHPEDTIPYVTPYGIQVILQNDAAAKGALSDAVFELLDYNGKSVTSPDGADSWLAQSDENGMLWFLGLTEGTYYLKMNTAPKGFESLSDVIPATLNDNNTSDNNVLTIPIDTIEQKGILPRPKTGDMENQLFLLIGISTVSGALIIGVLYAKKGKKR